MPSRKRNQGQERKAKASECLMKMADEKGVCRHGSMLIQSHGKMRRFLQEFFSLSPDLVKQTSILDRKHDFTGSHWYEAAKIMFGRYHHFWNEEAKRNLLKSHLLFHGVDSLLACDDDSAHDAGIFAMCVLFLERYDPHTCARDTEMFSEADMKSRDLIEGCWPSVVRFFARRIPCKCLDEMHSQAKSQAKTGVCKCCSERKERSDLMICTGCRTHPQQYCSRYCQVSDWPQHRFICKGKQTIEEDELFEQSIPDNRMTALGNILKQLPEKEQRTVLQHIHKTCPRALVTKGKYSRIHWGNMSSLTYWKVEKYVSSVMKYQRLKLKMASSSECKPKLLLES